MIESGREDRPARPLQLAPFRALRFCSHRVPDLAAVTCPPYDVIGESGIATWEAADPHNVVRLILPRPGPGEDRYEHAARDLRSWLSDGVLGRDNTPALYVYEHVSDAGTALGLVGAVSLHEPAERVVLPHEEVFPDPVADRAKLMAATGAQLEPILLTYSGGGPASDAVERTLASEPVIAVTTSDGATHRVWRLTDPGAIAEVQADLADRQALIADGHHRYAAYRALRAQHGLAMLVDAQRHPLRLGSIHRSVTGISVQEAVSRAAGFRAVTPLPTGLDPATALAEAEARPAFVISDGRNSVLLSALMSDQVETSLPAGQSATWRRLDASIACEFVLPRLFGVDDADRRVAYHHDVAAAITRARSHGGTALLVGPAKLDDVLAVAAFGELMPRKSTSFGPKPRTGLLMRLLREPPTSGPGPAAART